MTAMSRFDDFCGITSSTIIFVIYGGMSENAVVSTERIIHTISGFVSGLT